MSSTFHGLEVARRGLTTQQTALKVTGHNIANANTPGFSRQRVNFVQTEPYPPASMNRPQIPGQLGTGVQAGSIQRVRESFLDIQFRGENNKVGYWNARADALGKMEEIMNEPSSTGLAATLDQFWAAFQDLAVNPTNTGARSVVRQRGIAVAETFNYLSTSISAVQQDLKNEMDVTLKQVNSITQQINRINKQIGETEVHGYLPNDLYDERDRLIDDLSKIVNIKVTLVGSGGNSMSMAEGKFSIDLVDETGRKIGNLVDANRLVSNQLKLDYDQQTGLVSDFIIGDMKNDIRALHSSGKLKGLVEAYGYMEGSVAKGIYPEMLSHLDTLAYDFAMELNRVHESGWSTSSIQNGTHTAFSFFEFTNLNVSADNKQNAAKFLTISGDIRNSLDNIAASSYNGGAIVQGDFQGYNGVSNLTISLQSTNEGSYIYKLYDTSTAPRQEVQASGEFASLQELATALEDEFGGTVSFNLDRVLSSEVTIGRSINIHFEQVGNVGGRLGDGTNAVALADVKTRSLAINGVTTTFQDYYESVIGGMAVDAQEANRLSYNSETLKLAVDQRRQSVSAVSLDEEMTNMIQFQHAYNASARMITLTDELLDRIINGMGLAGR
ncbi:flagellar hook-associated protein FlgK [Bacillus sp. FJAT-45066]|uniref:flagellar hook-associated protein FlgK n=1 Tax=Bacillus sp. FJAT-45066 TaxID=2011010 RepID=UPI000BB991B2|nr:flagellar hook-associated protein FlgK [Bacillus sp. FJAT-45066]